MRWSVIVASLKHSYFASLSFASPRSKAAFSSLLSRVRDNSKSSLRSYSQAPAAIAKSGKASSVSQGKSVSIAEERVSRKAPSTQGTPESARSRYKTKDTLSASPSKAHLDSSKTRGNLSSNPVEGRDNRRSWADLGFDDSNKKFTKAVSSVHQISRGFSDVDAGRASPKDTKFSKTSKARPKLQSFESLADASMAMRESKGRSKGKVLSGEGWFGNESKSGSGNIRTAGSAVLSEKDVAFASSGSLGPRVDCTPQAKVTSEGFDEGEDNAGDKVKKSFLQVASPVNVFAEWWFYCYLRGYRPYPETLYCVDKLYLWLGAYQRVHLDVAGVYINAYCAAFLSEKLDALRCAVISKGFKWGDTEHIYLDPPLVSKKQSSSFLDTAFIFQDRVVQEVLYLVLEPIFESRFSTRSHASRPNRGAHTALRAAQRSFLGCNWFISGDLSILQEGDYATHLVNSVLKVVKDSRLTILLQRAFLGGKSEKLKLKGMHSSFLSATQGSCGRLNHLMCNALLDPLDWWMDEQISKFAIRGPLRESIASPPQQSSQRELFKLLTNHLNHPSKLEYVRYGMKFWVGCGGTEREVFSIQKDILSFLEKEFGSCLECKFSVSHISAGVNILDHIISQKIVRPPYICRRASSGRLFEKRALRIELCAKASIECCLKYLKQVAWPTSVQHIDETLMVLDYWYFYAENKAKVLMYCKLFLCFMYSIKGSLDECKGGSTEVEIAEVFKKAVETVASPEEAGGHPDGGKSFVNIPEHEMILRDHAWLQSVALTLQLKDNFKNMRKTSPQQSMSEVLWQYLRAENGDNDWDLAAQMQASGSEQGSVVEELAESAG